MEIKVRYIFLGILISIQVLAQQKSQVVETEKWSLEKIVGRATEKNPEINALEKDIERAENTARQAGKWDNPDISILAGPVNRSESLPKTEEVTLRQSFPLFGQKSILEKIAQKDKLITEIASRRQILLLKYEVVRLAYRLAALDAQSKHTLHRREKIGLIAKFLESRPFASPLQATEKNLILNRLREIEEKFLEISTARENAWKDLNVYLALEKQIIPNDPWLTEPRLPNRESLASNFEQQNPDLQAQKITIDRALLEVDQEEKKVYPDIRLGVGYQLDGAGSQHSYVGLLELTLPIVDRGYYGKQAALAQKDAATYRLEQRRRELLSQFDQSWNIVLQSKRRMELFPLSLIPTLEAQADTTAQNWKRGLIPATTYLDLESQVHDQVFRVYDAQTGYIEAVSQIKFLSGIEAISQEK